MASPQTVTNIESGQHHHLRILRTTGRDEQTTSIDVGATRKPVERAITAVDLPFEDLLSEQVSRAERRLTQSELYPVREAFRREHINALRLLAVGIGRCQRALQRLADNDVMAADTDIQKLQVLLPELFCCRSLGDGFGTIINALMSAFETLGGNIPDRSQIEAIRRLLAVLRDRPFLSPDEADEELERLEQVGLNPYPTELLDFLASE